MQKNKFIVLEIYLLQNNSKYSKCIGEQPKTMFRKLFTKDSPRLSLRIKNCKYLRSFYSELWLIISESIVSYLRFSDFRYFSFRIFRNDAFLTTWSHTVTAIRCEKNRNKRIQSNQRKTSKQKKNKSISHSIPVCFRAKK